MITLDPWQKELLEHDGNICAACGRQVGKSTIVSIKAGEYAVNHPNKVIMVISAVERQAYLLFEKILFYLLDNYKDKVKRGKDKPTQTKCKLTNGSIIYCLPCGMSGVGIRGYTIDVLIVDEAAFVPDEVYSAITPALLTTKAKIILLGTPHGRSGYFYRSFKDLNFRPFHVASWDCPRANKDFLAQEQARLTKLVYLQEYGGEFVESLLQYFPSDLIRKVMSSSRLSAVTFLHLFPTGDNFCGVDIASQGSDDTVIFDVRLENKEKIVQIDMEILKKAYLSETSDKIKQHDRKYNFSKIYVDDGGMGIAVFQNLLKDDQTKRKVIAINNASRSLDRDNKQKKRILKEDLYNNLLWLMETGKIELFDDPEIYMSLSSIQYEIDETTKKTKIWGNYSHICEALIRACWCITSKELNIWVH